ncbi:MAG: thiamine diphosphokinase [Dysgonamonadaceae bacterium]|jgi:thiamine pyrophosphokinase|nr:thiamine diphosphokinase [Dysgonamonadaceae bacterium]
MNKIPNIQDFRTVIVANGAFPEHKIPLSFLQKAERIICCDGATENLLAYGLTPDHIVGDLDSLSEELRIRYANILHHDPDQETNDLTKAIEFCRKNNRKEITILGATGKREDHSLANISLLADYIKLVKVQLLTDYGVFVPITNSTSFESFKGQQVSIFSLTPETFFTTGNLQYPLNQRNLTSWWQGSLNEASGNSFEIKINQGKVLIFREYFQSFIF